MRYGFARGSLLYYYVCNAQGDVVKILTSSGATAAWYEYDAWGNVVSVGGNASIANLNPIRYRGYYYDAETGFYYLNSRYYDPEICRFVNADGYVSTGQGLLGNNMFAYCLSDPINHIDPDGEFAITTAFLLTGLAVTLISGLDMGISASMCGQNFWAGFGAGCIGGIASCLILATPVAALLGPMAPVVARGAGTAVTGITNEFFQNGNLDNMNWGTYGADIMMDTTFSMLSPFQGISIPGALLDSTIDVAQTQLFYTPEAQSNIKKLSSSSTVATNRGLTRSTSTKNVGVGGSRIKFALY